MCWYVHKSLLVPLLLAAGLSFSKKKWTFFNSYNCLLSNSNLTCTSDCKWQNKFSTFKINLNRTSSPTPLRKVTLSRNLYETCTHYIFARKWTRIIYAKYNLQKNIYLLVIIFYRFNIWIIFIQPSSVMPFKYIFPEFPPIVTSDYAPTDYESPIKWGGF